MTRSTRHLRTSMCRWTRTPAHYVVSLLTLYSRTEVSHGDTRPGQRWVSLVELLVQAGEARTPLERAVVLQRWATSRCSWPDSSPDGFERRLVDVDYTIRQWVGARTALWRQHR